MNPLERVFVGVLCGCLIGGCGSGKKMTEPTRKISFCIAPKLLNVARLRAVAASIYDGDYYKGDPDFERRVKPLLEQSGGGVGYWPDAAFHLPIYQAYDKRWNLRMVGVAVPDDVPNAVNHRRFVYIGFRNLKKHRIEWGISSATDLDAVCEK